MDKEIEAFRKEVLRWRGARRQGARPYTSAMKAKALELTAGLRSRGLTVESAAKQVGISAATLYAWKKMPGRAGMLAVRIARDTGLARSGLAGSTVQLVSPRGYRVGAPDLATAVALLRELG
jgi:transposase-like protein